MHITRYTDYALRVLMYVALKGGQQCTIAEIADSYQVSKNHLMKVVQALNNQGYLIAARGKNGGLRLKDNAGNINIGELIRNTEQDFALVECFHADSNCAIDSACRLKKVFNEALESFFETLDQYTLADLLPKRNQPALIRYLGINIEA